VDQTEAFKAWVIDKAIQPNAEEIGRIANTDGIAVVVYRPEGAARILAERLGWKAAAVFRLSAEDIAWYSDAVHPVTAKWLRREADGSARMLVIAGTEALLLNYSDQRGYWIEPGSTDAERKASAS
jgi:hypothetical protein